jgi:hypothetical protein
MQVIPTIAVPAQTLNVILGTQSCALNIYAKATGLFIDVLVGGIEIVSGVICQNCNPIVRDGYLGFSGDLVFLDNTGAGNDASYDGLGSTYSLIWLEPSDLPAGSA